jgi:flagellar biosynthesis/type III secretory pathway protein FliH
MSNDKLTPVEWLIEQFYNNEKMLTTDQLLRAKQVEKERMQEQYQEGREIGQIEILATQSTNNADAYSEGYKKGYLNALQFMNSTIENKIKLRK